MEFSSPKARSLQMLEGLGLPVPAYQVFPHDRIVKSGDPELYQELLNSLKHDADEVIHEKARVFSQSLSIEIKHIEHKHYAIRSSAHHEDSSEFSFAGVYETKLGIHDQLLAGVREVWLSLYSLHSLSLCRSKNLSLEDLRMDVILQDMIKGHAGVLFRDNVQVVSLAGNLYFLKDAEFLGSQIINTSLVLSQVQIEQLLAKTTALENQDIEFIFQKNLFVFVQSRPITVPLPPFSLNSEVDGLIASDGSAEGSVCLNPSLEMEVKDKILILKEERDVPHFLARGPQAFVIEKGSLLSHAGTLCRELGIPCLIGVKDALTRYAHVQRLKLENGKITIS